MNKITNIQLQLLKHYYECSSYNITMIYERDFNVLMKMNLIIVIKDYEDLTFHRYVTFKGMWYLHLYGNV